MIGGMRGLGLDKSAGGIVTGIMTGGVSNLFGGGGGDASASDNDVRIQALKEATKTENVRQQNVRQTAVARINAAAATSASRWTPVIVVVAGVVIGGLVLAIATRRKLR